MFVQHIALSNIVFTFINTAKRVKMMVNISLPSGLLGPTCENQRNVSDSGKNK